MFLMQLNVLNSLINFPNVALYILKTKSIEIKYL